MGDRTTQLKMLCARETGDRGKIGPATEGALLLHLVGEPPEAARWIPRKLIEDITDRYTVGTGEILDVEVPMWKARQNGWSE